MPQISCSICGEPHDLGNIDPAFTRPEAYVQIPPDQRGTRANHGDEGCIVVSEDGSTLTYYVRAVLYVPIRGEAKPIGWGLWVEVDHATYMTVGDHLQDLHQSSLGPFPATLANRLPHYPETLGLPGTVQPTGPTTRPTFRFSPLSTHPFAKEALNGVLPERALEWRLWSIHPPSRSAG